MANLRNKPFSLAKLICCVLIAIIYYNQVDSVAARGAWRSRALLKAAKSTPPGIGEEYERTRVGLTPRFRTTTANVMDTTTMTTTDNTTQADVLLSRLQYVVTVELGTPSTQLTLVMDTGSQIAWTQCEPCVSCYTQNDPIFNPNTSSTYSPLACAANLCTSLGASHHADCSAGNYCQYVVQYGDGSLTTGDFATDVLSLNGRTLSESYPVGCGHSNTGIFDVADGLMGFNKGAFGFPAQAQVSSFAYCLSSPTDGSSTSGYLDFPASSDAGSCTDMGEPGTTQYYIQLLSMSVNGQQYSQNSYDMLVDSGTVITRLPTQLYNDVRDAFVTAMQISPIANYSYSLFDTCFAWPSDSVNYDDLPSLSFTFADGLTFTPSNEGLLLGPFSNGDSGSKVYCFAFAGTDGTAILGSFQQQRHQFKFDIANSQICILTDQTSC